MDPRLALGDDKTKNIISTKLLIKQPYIIIKDKLVNKLVFL